MGTHLPIYPSSSSTPSSAHILLADDNADMRDYVKRLLSQFWEVETVGNGSAALEAINQRLPDLVLSDVMMPGLDGFGLLRELRAAPRTREIPIILLSARAGEEARIEGLEAGADDYLTKPFSARELVARVEATLKLAHLRREATQQEQALRQEAETAKQQAEAAYTHINQILECMTDAFVAFDRNWYFTYANPAALHLLQKSSEELIGKNVWQEVFPSEVGEIAYQELHRAVEEQVSVNWEEFSELMQRWLGVRAYPSTEGVAVYFQDITDRKRAEEAMRQSEEKLRLAITSARMVAWTWNGSTDRIIRSETACDILGLSPENLSGSGAEGWNLVHPDDLAGHQATVEAAIANRSNYLSQFRMIRPDNGAVIWVEDRGRVNYDAQGNLLSVEGILFDITMRKQAEAEREQLLAREQAIREQAEAANRIKDEFLAMVSHELRSPLNPILGWSKLLRTRRLDEQKTERALEVIERNAQMQAQLINDLLDVSRILRGKLSLESHPVDLAFTIQAAMETVRLAAEARSIQIHTQFDPEVGQVSGDAGRLQQVVWNLLANAVKFTSEGGRVEVKLERYEFSVKRSQLEETTQNSALKTQHSKYYAQITVTDTGKGIPPNFLPYVFEQFRQESSATTRRFGGLGLGLAIVRYLVELHGGTVQADSPGEGQGATFTVRLPLIPQQPTLTQTGPLSEPSLDLQGIRILVVDDDDNSREFLAFFLELQGVTVTATASAAEAIASLTQFKPDILLSDIGMPDVDGYMLMQQIRALPPDQGRDIPAIALTAYAGEIDYQRAIAAGFQHHIAKPIEPQVLIQAIANLIHQKSK
ncbi:response regulator [Kovacikia minuta]|uniref:response regulator n=1 Tax=Kovacikia minuta TaxID=2931930 RepID=UPI0036F26C03